VIVADPFANCYLGTPLGFVPFEKKIRYNFLAPALFHDDYKKLLSLAGVSLVGTRLKKKDYVPGNPRLTAALLQKSLLGEDR